MRKSVELRNNYLPFFHFKIDEKETIETVGIPIIDKAISLGVVEAYKFQNILFLEWKTTDCENAVRECAANELPFSDLLSAVSTINATAEEQIRAKTRKGKLYVSRVTAGLQKGTGKWFRVKTIK